MIISSVARDQYLVFAMHLSIIPCAMKCASYAAHLWKLAEQTDIQQAK